MKNDASFPDFIVIGAMRAGTTTLYHHLQNHPQIGMSRMKETDFFIKEMNYPLDFRWYRSQFSSGFGCYGEVSPNYTKHDVFRGVPERIAKAAPETRLIFIARDPVDRFISHYLHSWHIGHCRVGADDLLESDNGKHMLECSRYAAQLEDYLAHFPRDRLLILDFNELRRDTQTFVDRVTDFLDLPSFHINEAVTRNETDSTARMPGFVQRAWRSRTMRRFDRYISREMRDTARTLLSIGPRRADPDIGPELRRQAGLLLKSDAEAFRRLSGMEFADWSV